MYEELPMTGPAAIVIGGVTIYAWWLAVLLVILGAALIGLVRYQARDHR